MAIQINARDIIVLMIFFTIIAFYLDIHRQHRILTFIINHFIALVGAILISRLIYDLISHYNK